jgi:type 1 fimbria pilin
MLSKIALAALSAAALAPGSALAADAAGFTLDISGTVPVICRAEMTANVVAPKDGRVSLGQMNEFCNDANGYEVYAEHSPELANAVVVVDGVEVKLSATGTTRISRSDTAGIASRNVELRLADGQSAGTLSIRVVAL